MTLIQTDVQPEVTYGRVTGYFVSYLADSTDAGTIPDEIPLTGTVLLTPLTSVTRWPTTVPPRLAIGKQASCPVVNGYLCTPGSAIHDVWLVATDQPEGQPDVIQWKASFRFDGVTVQPADVVFNVPAGGSVDLALIATVPPAPGTIVIVSHEDALRAEAAADAAEQSAEAAGDAAAAKYVTGAALLQSNMQVLLTKLHRAIEDASVLVISDSTAALTYRWVYVAAQQIAARYPTWTVKYNLWNATSGAAYDSPVTIQTGTGPRTLNVWNLSVSGTQTSYGLAGRYPLGIAATNPDLIVVAHGKNEQYPTADLETNRNLWRGQMHAVTERVSYTHPNAGIVLMLQPRNSADTYMALRNRVYEDIAARRGFGIVSVYDAYEDTGHPNDFLVDGIHPTSALDPPAPPPGPGQTTPARDGVALWVLTFMTAFAYDPHGKTSAQQESAFVQISEQLLPNGNFAAFTSAVPDSWTATGCTTTKDVRAGWFESANGYAVRIQATGAAASLLSQYLPSPAAFYAGKTVTLRVKGKIALSARTTSTALRIGLTDGVSTTALSYTKYDATDGFFDQIVSLKVAAAPNYLRVLIYADSAANPTADVTIDAAYVTLGLLPRKGSSGAVGPAGVPGPVAASFDHLSTMGTNPALAYAANTPFILVANQGIAVPVIPNRNMTPTKLTWAPGVASGNYDVAILDSAGVRLWSKGSTAVTSGVKTETVSGVNLVSGQTYWLMIAMDNGTAQIYGLSAQYEGQGRLATNVPWMRTVNAVFPIPPTVALGATGSAKVPLMTLIE